MPDAPARPCNKTLIDLMGDAIEKLIEKEETLFDIDINERSLSHKLAEHMQPIFQDWNVDCEYNRLDDQKKILPRPGNTQTDDTHGRTIFPDIIVHKRRFQENLLVIEIKKHTNDDGNDLDIYKLSSLTDVEGRYGYPLGLHVIFNMQQRCVSDVTAFVRGATDKALTSLLAERLRIGKARGD